ncbi:iron chelate uptake ABC transporter family permease subunit [Alkaliphilus sp. MSJ-5]|uniref:Iron chelate uptake ABC transporter family permease subunit n=1 Tax=Alkaliphilus flagellatus TaxID=2841507 RepID=A0ABS6FZA5_9FIRM|nr:iron chelate uptake ABC transporter family permease subunit [Alkaliphilus flagellatus]MBU5675389.1 iron chelate uptake ABC transporter family permease subunit [Alkaliphilus flagellatus]
MEKHNYLKIFPLLLMTLMITISISLVIGVANVTIIDSIKIILKTIPIIGDYIDVSNIQKSHIAIIQNIRLPRVLLSFLVGYGLSIVGVAFQGMLKNPMADPFIVGTSSGAALGASIAILLKLNKMFFGIGIVSIFAFTGALLATLIVYNMARIKGKVPVTTLLLAGIATGQFFTAIMSFIMTISTRDVSTIIFWTMGSFSGRGWNHIQIAIIPVLLGSIIIYIFSKDLNIMLLGEDSAQNMGVETEKVKKVILITSVLITAFLVSVSGIIGFVGLIVPHMVRLLMGPDHRILIPASGLVGGIFLIVADTLSRTIIAPTEVPVGIITALAGGPFFIYLLRKTKRTV